MTRAIPALIALSLAACSAHSTQLAPHPEIPPLSAETAAECPPAEQLADPTLGSIVQADAALAILYAKCREKHRSAVAAYDLVRTKLSPKSP